MLFPFNKSLFIVTIKVFTWDTLISLQLYFYLSSFHNSFFKAVAVSYPFQNYFPEMREPLQKIDPADKSILSYFHEFISANLNKNLLRLFTADFTTYKMACHYCSRASPSITGHPVLWTILLPYSRLLIIEILTLYLLLLCKRSLSTAKQAYATNFLQAVGEHLTIIKQNFIYPDEFRYGAVRHNSKSVEAQSILVQVMSPC